VGQLLSQLANHVAALVREEMALAKQEFRETFRSLGLGATILAVGALFGLISLATLAAAAVIGLAQFMAACYAALIVAGGLALIAGGAAVIGINRLRRTSLRPEQTMQTLEEDKEWFKGLT